MTRATTSSSSSSPGVPPASNSLEPDKILKGAEPANVGQALRLDGGCIVCSTFDGGTLSIFGTKGHPLQKAHVQAGKVCVKVLPLREAGMPFIPGLDTGVRAFARKFVPGK